MHLHLEGKVAVVTGGSRGIGRAVVAELVGEGVSVVTGARDVSSLSEPGVQALSVDLSTPDAPAKLIEYALEHHGGIDFLVNNAASGRLHFDGFGSISEDDWRFAFETSFMSAVRTTRAALPHLVERRGAVVNVSSLNGQIPATEAPEYSAMKAALNNLSRSLAVELAPRGVRVNTVSPGPVRTEMQVGAGGVAEQVAAATGGTVEDYVAAVEQAVPLRRFAEPAEVAAMIVALLSGRLGFITGANIAVDGATQAG